MENLISECPVSLVFKKVYKDQLEGILTVEGEEVTRRLFFRNGVMQFATTTAYDEHLGTFLVSGGAIDAMVMQTMKGEVLPEGEKIGKFLIKNRYVTKEQVFDALKRQMLVIGAKTLAVPSGRWGFVIKTPVLSSDQLFNVRLPEIICKGSTLLTNTSFYENIFLYKCPVSTEVPREVFDLAPVEVFEFLTELNNFNQNTNQQILHQLDIPEKDYWKKVVLLYLLNVIDFVNYRVDPKLNEKIEKIQEIHDHLQDKTMVSVNYSDLEKTMVSEKLARENLPVAPDSRASEQAAFILQKVYEVEKQPTVKKKTEEPNPAGQEQQPARQENPIRVARDLYLKANTMYEEGKFRHAVTLMQKALSLDSSRSNYFLLLGLSQGKIPSMMREAEINLKTVAKLEPWNADPLFYLGELFKSQNLPRMAEKYFRQALQINLEHTLAGHQVRQIEEARKGKFFNRFTRKVSK